MTDGLERYLVDALTGGIITSVITAEQSAWSVRPAGVVIRTRWDTYWESVYVAMFPFAAGTRLDFGVPLTPPAPTPTQAAPGLAYIHALLASTLDRARDILTVWSTGGMPEWAHPEGLITRHRTGRLTLLMLMSRPILAE